MKTQKTRSVSAPKKLAPKKGPDREIQPGDLVKLKSDRGQVEVPIGSQRVASPVEMTVESISTDARHLATAKCSWFDRNQEFRTETISVKALVRLV